MPKHRVQVVDLQAMAEEKPTGNTQTFFEDFVGCGESAGFMHKTPNPLTRLLRNKTQQDLSVIFHSSTLSTPPTTITTNTYIKD